MLLRNSILENSSICPATRPIIALKNYSRQIRKKMTKYTKQHQPSPQTQDEAYKIALGIQRPGQTKEQTKLIAQGIIKGIDIYKSQQKAKARGLDKLRKKLVLAPSKTSDDTAAPQTRNVSWRTGLPWLLLTLSWIFILVAELKIFQ